MRRKRRTRSITRGITRSLVDPLSSGIAGVFGRGLSGLLSFYPGAAAGYSLRKIGSGPVVRLRRASDNEERDFSAGELTGSVVGSQVILNPEFDNATGWSATGGWSITGGQAVNSGTNGNLQQGSRVTVGNYYIATLEIVACSNFDDLRLRFGATTAYSLSNIGITTAGTYQIAFQAQSTFFLILTTNSATATIEFAGCEEYTPTTAEQWTIEGVGNTTQLFAYAATWYDQSGSGNDATQATAASQPLLIRAGVTNTENGKPALSFDGTDDYLTGSSVPMLGNDWAAFATYAPLSTAGQGLFESVDASSISNRIVILSSSGTSPDNAVNYAADGTGRFAADTIDKTSGQQYLRTVTYDAANLVPYLDGVAQTSVAASGISTSLLDQFTIGRQALSNLYADANLQELVIYDSDQSTNRVGIETNINEHYGIY